ncbi:MAG: DUF3822 family protein [Bacteroidia bacterium]|nr:DUF3822 family protein [Bacteroidia bacterium]
MRDICFIDKTFDNAQTHLYHLSIQISLDGFYFSVLDIPKGKYIVLTGHHFFLKRARLLLKHVREVIESEDIFNLDFKSIEILYAARKFTLVPQAFYGRGSLDKYLWFNNIQEKGFVVEKNLFPKAGCWCIFDIPQNLSEYLSAKFPKINVKHNLFPLVEGTLKRNLAYSEREQVHLNFFRDCFEIVVVNGSKLVHCNIFNYKTDRDVLYHVLFTFDQLKLSPESTELILHGQMPQVSPVYHLFKKYVKLTSFARLDTTFQYSYTFSQLPEHYYSSLLSVYKCE